MIKVFIVDDHSMVRSGLNKILREESDIEVTAEANGHTELFSRLKVSQPDVILLDISMPGKNGLEIVKDVKQYYPRTKMLMLSMHPEDRFSVRAIKAGASGYVTKESAAEELVQAIRNVYHGGKYITNSVAEKLADSFTMGGDKAPHERLSDREFQILCLIASGKKTSQIAKDLSLSPATVGTYRARLQQKMQLKSNVELSNYAHQHNLIE
jgi:two-component system, NarL family, invasion response regulator UvrY